MIVPVGVGYRSTSTDPHSRRSRRIADGQTRLNGVSDACQITGVRATRTSLGVVSAAQGQQGQCVVRKGLLR